MTRFEFCQNQSGEIIELSSIKIILGPFSLDEVFMNKYCFTHLVVNSYHFILFFLSMFWVVI